MLEYCLKEFYPACLRNRSMPAAQAFDAHFCKKLGRADSHFQWLNVLLKIIPILSAGTKWRRVLSKSKPDSQGKRPSPADAVFLPDAAGLAAGHGPFRATQTWPNVSGETHGP